MIIILCRSLLAFFLTSFHPFFVSVTEVEYSTTTREMGISTKFFTDDFEETLKADAHTKVDLKKGDTFVNRKIIESYLKKHIQINANKQQVNFRLLGFENDNEATWCFYVAEKVPAASSIHIDADFLYEFRKEQTNLFHVIIDGNRKSSRLNFPEKSLDFSF